MSLPNLRMFEQDINLLFNVIQVYLGPGRLVGAVEDRGPSLVDRVVPLLELDVKAVHLLVVLAFNLENSR